VDATELFWDLATDLVGRDGVEEGTIMGSPCLRASGEFFAMPEHRGGGLVAKLPAARVDELVAGGTGEPFAPAGKVFKEWVLIRQPDAALWNQLLQEARGFVA